MIPTRLLRTLTLRARAETIDETDGSMSLTWTDTEVLGRLDRMSSMEVLTQGRSAEVSLWRLLTNDEIPSTARVIDGDAEYEVDGETFGVYTARGLHHFETSLRRVEG